MKNKTILEFKSLDGFMWITLKYIDGRYCVGVTHPDGHAVEEFDDIDIAFQQYRDWVETEELHAVANTKFLENYEGLG